MITFLSDGNMADTSIAPRELITPGGFNAALPAWQEFPAYSADLTWTSGSKGIIIYAHSENSRLLQKMKAASPKTCR